MNLFVVGDVHGCYHTFLNLLLHWQPEEELLIQVGDLVDRGNFAPECVALAMELSVRYPTQTVFLRGNHESGMLAYYQPNRQSKLWLNWGGRTTVQQYEAQPQLLATHLAWLEERPLFWENKHVFVSHAGISASPDAFDEESHNGLLWYRGQLRNIGKLQVIGHTPTNGLVLVDSEANYLNLDTGAVYGQALTGVRISAEGQRLDTISITTCREDSPRVSQNTR
jgi:serine/threonine protein phosphatase 1